MTRTRPDVPRPPTPPSVTKSAAIDTRKLQLAKSLRREPTPAEAAAWHLLRGRRMLGLKFRRQQVIAGFIVDFYCPSRRLALELDGAVHDEPDQAAHDALRTRALAHRAIRVVPLRNEELDEHTLCKLLSPYVERGEYPLPEVLAPSCNEPSPPPSPPSTTSG